MIGKGNEKRGEAPFWETKSLEEMTPEEWESLCDGCARCCLEKMEDERTGQVRLTAIACAHLDIETCRCKVYATRERDGGRLFEAYAIECYANQMVARHVRISMCG
jgi:hypothetical protein